MRGENHPKVGKREHCSPRGKREVSINGRYTEPGSRQRTPGGAARKKAGARN